MKTLDEHLDCFVSAQFEHIEKIEKLKNPFDKAIEEFSYNKVLQENIDSFRAFLLKNDFDEILPTLLLNFDLYDEFKN